MPPGDAFLLFRKLVPKPFQREKCLPMDGTTQRSEVNLESHPSQTNQTWCHQLRASLSALLGLLPSTAPRQRLCTFLKNSFQLKCDFTPTVEPTQRATGAQQNRGRWSGAGTAVTVFAQTHGTVAKPKSRVGGKEIFDAR